MTARCKLKNRDRNKTATGEPVQDERFRVLPIVTVEGLNHCMHFRVVLVHKALGRCAIKVTEPFWIEERELLRFHSTSRSNQVSDFEGHDQESIWKQSTIEAEFH